MTRLKWIGELPRGNWQFCLVRIRGQADVVVVADRTGQNAPRMVIDGKLVSL
jgi:hypothetical protein